ncbi:hypothetical protein EON67_08105 [archaeon]|nr:MAG: hypothetical protein EON67_08105 [archaeon]
MDTCRGVSESIIIGSPIPLGTGMFKLMQQFPDMAMAAGGKGAAGKASSMGFSFPSVAPAPSQFPSTGPLTDDELMSRLYQVRFRTRSSCAPLARPYALARQGVCTHAASSLPFLRAPTRACARVCMCVCVCVCARVQTTSRPLLS